MKLPKDQPFWTSVILHLVVLVALFLATMIETLKPKEKPHVFEMVSPPSEQANMAAAIPTPPMPDIPNLDLPDVPDLAAVPDPVVERPTPAPKPPVPTPSPVKPKPKWVNWDDYVKEHGAPKPKQQVRPTTPRSTVSVPTIDVPTLVVPTTPSATGLQRPTAQQMSALGAYSAKLRASIDRAWAKPGSLAGVGVAATVVFDVSASGRITNARLTPGSGNSAFDQSVLAAFRRAVSAGPTPTGQGHIFTMTFRMQD